MTKLDEIEAYFQAGKDLSSDDIQMLLKVARTAKDAVEGQIPVWVLEKALDELE